MRKRIFLLAAMLCLLSSASMAQANKAIGITFHYFSGTYTDESFFNLVCQINKNYNSSNSMGLHFYIHDIKAASFNSTLGPIGSSPKESDINIYLYGSSGQSASYSGTNDVIWTPFWDAEQLTHEIGHYFGLNHPTGGSPGGQPGWPACQCTSTGDPDCVSDTPPGGAPGNWMNQSSGNTIFTAGQKKFAHDCANSGNGSRLITHANSGVNAGGVAYNFTYIMALPRIVNITEETGDLIWAYPTASGCATLPFIVEIEVITFCDSPSNEYKLLYDITDLTSASTISTYWGIKEIRYKYYYSSGYVNIIVHPYNLQPHPSAPCNTSPPDDQGRYAGHVENAVNRFAITNNPSATFIGIQNTGYKNVVIYDLSGKVLIKKDILDGYNEISVADLPAGSYIIKAINDKEAVHKKFSKI